MPQPKFLQENYIMWRYVEPVWGPGGDRDQIAISVFTSARPFLSKLLALKQFASQILSCDGTRLLQQSYINGICADMLGDKCQDPDQKKHLFG